MCKRTTIYILIMDKDLRYKDIYSYYENEYLTFEDYYFKYQTTIMVMQLKEQ